jgi:pilus assembly protein TadC
VKNKLWTIYSIEMEQKSAFQVIKANKPLKIKKMGSDLVNGKWMMPSGPERPQRTKKEIFEDLKARKRWEDLKSKPERRATRRANIQHYAIILGVIVSLLMLIAVFRDDIWNYIYKR